MISTRRIKIAKDASAARQKDEQSDVPPTAKKTLLATLDSLKPLDEDLPEIKDLPPRPVKLCQEMAEEEGFEPPVEFPLLRFSRPLPSTARPFLHY
jgi:hypothetical protein